MAKAWTTTAHEDSSRIELYCRKHPTSSPGARDEGWESTWRTPPFGRLEGRDGNASATSLRGRQLTHDEIGTALERVDELAGWR